MRMPAWLRRKAASKIGDQPAERSLEILEAKLQQSGNEPPDAESLASVLRELPAVRKERIDWGYEGQTGLWWCQISIDLEHPDAHRVIQCLAYELNNPNANDFQGAFYPSSPPSNLNKDPDKVLTWMIDSWDGETSAKDVAKMLDLVPLEFADA